MNSDIVNGAVSATRTFISANQADILFAVCVVAIIGFLIACSALIRCSRLKSELRELRRSTQRLISSEEKRLLKEMSDAASSKPPLKEPH